MKLSEEIKNKIKEEYSNFKDKQYAGKPLEERKKKDQFFTPAVISMQMIGGFDCDSLKDKTILDPCCGSGNLLAACIIAGAQPKKIFMGMSTIKIYWIYADRDLIAYVLN